MSNEVFYSSCEQMSEVSSNSTALVLGSPPYSLTTRGSVATVRKKYSSLLSKNIIESSRILVPGGKLVFVLTDEKHKGQIWSKSGLVVKICLEHGFRFVDHIIWKKSERNLFRISFAHILVFQKAGKPHTNRNQHLDFIFHTKIWDLPDSQVRITQDGKKFTAALHPAIANRMISRFTKPKDLVVNPFVGSGTVLGVAKLMNRRWIGYETNRGLKKFISESLTESNSKISKKLVDTVRSNL